VEKPKSLRERVRQEVTAMAGMYGKAEG
jgi:hypothetical protein